MKTYQRLPKRQGRMPFCSERTNLSLDRSRHMDFGVLVEVTISPNVAAPVARQGEPFTQSATHYQRGDTTIVPKKPSKNLSTNKPAKLSTSDAGTHNMTKRA
jgi:hypothetical protein